MNHEARGHLQALFDANRGRLTPAQVVDAARPANSPLHPFFTWNTREAAERWREEQARRLIRSITVVVTTSPLLTHAPRYVRDPRAEPNVAQYVSLARLRNDEDAAREVVVTEFVRAAAGLKRARAVAAALGLSDVIDGLIGSIETVQRGIEEAPRGRG